MNMYALFWLGRYLDTITITPWSFVVFDIDDTGMSILFI